MAIEKKKTISMRLTEDEYEELKKTACKLGYTLSELIREKLFKKKIKFLPKQDIKQLLYELNKIGNNINQIAKKVNTEKAIDRIVAEELIRIRTILEEALKNDYKIF